MIKKITVLLICFCFFVLCSCNVETEMLLPDNSDDSEIQEIKKEEIDSLKVIRVSSLGNNNNETMSNYDEAKIIYPSPSKVINGELKESERILTVGETDYTLKYFKSMVYEDGVSDFLKDKAYDTYRAEGITLQIYQKSGYVKHLSLLSLPSEEKATLISDFSEAKLKETAVCVLNDIYGSGINGYLGSYYKFESAGVKKISNDSEDDLYRVRFRAYLNGIATDDTIVVSFSKDGKLAGVSAPRYLQYFDYGISGLFRIDDLNMKIDDFVSELGFGDAQLYDQECPCYYTMNYDGELYYQTTWEVMDATAQIGTWMESFFIKAK